MVLTILLLTLMNVESNFQIDYGQGSELYNHSQ